MSSLFFSQVGCVLWRVRTGLGRGGGGVLSRGQVRGRATDVSGRGLVAFAAACLLLVAGCSSAPKQSGGVLFPSESSTAAASPSVVGGPMPMPVGVRIDLTSGSLPKTLTPDQAEVAMCRYFDADEGAQAKLRGMDIGPKPDPKAVRVFVKCSAGGVVTQQARWESPGQRAGAGLSVQDGYAAVGRVDFPVVSVGTSVKESLAVIYQPVSWWAQGASAKPLRGSSAAGLVAIATPDRVDVMTGEAGVGVKRCGFVVSAATAGSCASEYGMSSVHGTASTKWGPSYTATVATFYTITFELNGNPTTIPGFTTDWPGPSATAPIGVAEIQSLVGPQQ